MYERYRDAAYQRYTMGLRAVHRLHQMGWVDSDIMVEMKAYDKALIRKLLRIHRKAAADEAQEARYHERCKYQEIILRKLDLSEIANA